MNIEKVITEATIEAVKELYGQDVPEKMVQLQKTKDTFEGNLTLVVFSFLKISHKKPEDTAQQIGEVLQRDCEAVARFNVVKGFLNLVVAPQAWVSLLNDINADDKFGEKQATDDSPLVMIEYSSSRSTSDTCATTCSDGASRRSWRPTATRSSKPISSTTVASIS